MEVWLIPFNLYLPEFSIYLTRYFFDLGLNFYYLNSPTFYTTNTLRIFVTYQNPWFFMYWYRYCLFIEGLSCVDKGPIKVIRVQCKYVVERERKIRLWYIYWSLLYISVWDGVLFCVDLSMLMSSVTSPWIVLPPLDHQTFFLLQGILWLGQVTECICT